MIKNTQTTERGDKKKRDTVFEASLRQFITFDLPRLRGLKRPGRCEAEICTVHGNNFLEIPVIKFEREAFYRRDI